jgi:hypothetical protein
MTISIAARAAPSGSSASNAATQRSDLRAELRDM